jgi:hypothetical protein
LADYIRKYQFFIVKNALPNRDIKIGSLVVLFETRRILKKNQLPSELKQKLTSLKIYQVGLFKKRDMHLTSTKSPSGYVQVNKNKNIRTGYDVKTISPNKKVYILINDKLTAINQMEAKEMIQTKTIDIYTTY